MLWVVFFLVFFFLPLASRVKIFVIVFRNSRNLRVPYLQSRRSGRRDRGLFLTGAVGDSDSGVQKAGWAGYHFFINVLCLSGFDVEADEFK